MTKVVFHLGDKKTGSTAIQTAIASKSWTCDTVSMLYPGKDRINHIALAKSLHRRTGSATEIANRFGEVERDIRKHNPDVAVISAEDFEDVDPAALKAAVLEYMPDYAAQARYISYVRPHAERLASSYAERVKAGGVLGTMGELFDRFRQNGMLYYTPRFGKWRETFGDAFELRPMIRDRLYKNDVVQDFLLYVLGTEDFKVANVPNANESVSLENLAVLRELQLTLRPETEGRTDLKPAFGRYIARQMNKSTTIKGTKVQIHRSLAEQMVVECVADAKALDAAFFTGAPMLGALRAAPGKAVEQEQSIRIEDHYSEREQYLIRFWLTQIESFVKVDPENWARVLRLEQRDWVTGASGPGGNKGTPESATGPRAGKGGAGKGGGKGPMGGGKAGGGKRLGAGPGKAGLGKGALGKGGAGKGGLRMAGRGRAGKPAADTEE